MPCEKIEGGWLCRPGLMEVLKEVPLGVKWCFVCRKRVKFSDCLMGEVDPTGYYEPLWDVRCEKGHADGDLFPGRTREEPF